MRFADPELQNVLTAWRHPTAAWERSCADNLWFEERLSAARQTWFESEVRGAKDPDALRRRQTDYWNDFVKVDDGVPDSFRKALAPADLGALHETQAIVRLESLVRPLGAHGVSFEELKAAVERNDAAMIEGFLRVWNNMRDRRPVFAAFKDEVLEILAAGDWPRRLRDRLGLAHYDGAGAAIPVALMEYTVAEIQDSVSSSSEACAFAAPTVLDSEPWPYFFPAPRDLPCGRTMSLVAVGHERELLSEMLHVRMIYQRNHLVRVAELPDPLPTFELRTLRNTHLLTLQAAAERGDFGEEIGP
jgi:hypothetical protein